MISVIGIKMLSKRVRLFKQSIRKLSVSAIEGNSLRSELYINVRAGSRYAPKDGLAHLLSRFNFHNTSNKSALRLVREAELMGGKFSCKVDREHIILSASFLKEYLPYFVSSLANVLYRTSFRPHEMPESVLPAAMHDLMIFESDPMNKAEDLLHSATFRNGLGRPVLYDGVDKVSLEEIKNYADEVYTKENIQIVGKDVNEADLKNFVSESLLTSLPTGVSKAKSLKVTTHSGELRLRAAGDSVAAISVPVETKDFAVYQALATYLRSALYKSSSLITKVKLNKYLDCGLFTLYVKDTDPSVVANNIKSIVTDLKASIDISIVKKLAELDLQMEDATPVEISFDKVKNFKLDKFNYVVVGNVSNLPYSDEF